jgi:hypothetical protein
MTPRVRPSPHQPSSPVIEGGKLVTGAEQTPQPALMVDEPAVLGAYRAMQDDKLNTYGWVDQAMGTVRLPIERAKDLVLERGLPVRQAPAAAPAAAASGEP